MYAGRAQAHALTPQVFAYGQTGSGKTYTMGTAASVKEVSGKGEATGVIPRSIKAIFATMQQARADYDVTMKVCTNIVLAAAKMLLVMLLMLIAA